MTGGYSNSDAIVKNLFKPPMDAQMHEKKKHPDWSRVLQRGWPEDVPTNERECSTVKLLIIIMFGVLCISLSFVHI